MSDERSAYEVMAERLGREYGRNAAEWAIEPDRMEKEQMLRILKVIENGDAACLSQFREPTLSGESDGETAQERIRDQLGIEPEEDEEADVIQEAWEEAARDAFWAKIEEILRCHSDPECTGQNDGTCPKHPNIVITDKKAVGI